MVETRRGFLKRTLGASALVAFGSTVPRFLARSARAAAAERGSPEGETVLVVLQLSGGNDGLNTVVPFEDDRYARSRPTLRLAKDEVLAIDGELGFHPALKGFSRLYQDGLMAIVQGVGYPNPNDDHFWAMWDWQTARPHDRTPQTGWLGRAADAYRGGRDGVGADTPVAFVGDIAQPFTLHAARAIVPSIRSAKDLALAGPAAATPQPSGADPLLDFVRRASVTAGARAERAKAAAEGRIGGTAADYPEFELAGKLRTIAQLIRADLGIRIFYTDLGGEPPGGFDNHAIQYHNHAALLRHLGESVAAFADDLRRDKVLDRVLLMTFSEFGRTLGENGRHGTGHGSAAPMFLVGGKVKAGLVGPHPSLAELENGGPKHHTDFRRLYATALDRWLGFDSVAALGERFEPLEVVRG